MTTTKSPAYRSHTTPPTERIQYRQPEDSEDGVFEVRMPIATTGEVRNEGDDPLTRSELDGMAQQIESRTVGVFLDHGGTNLGGMERYSAIEKVGEWREPTVETRDDEDSPAELVATARLMDPESLPAGVGDLRAALGSIKEQVKRDFSVSASIGWREDDSYPGGNDLMEASIVGIGADPRTTSEAADAEVVARAAVEAGADPDRLLEEVRAVVGEPDDDTERVTEDTNTGNDSEAGTTDDEQNQSESEDEYREFMREQQEQQTELLRTLTEAIREDDEDEDDEDEDEQEADTQDADDDTDERLAEMEDTLEKIRQGEIEIESPGGDDPDDEQDAEDTTAGGDTLGDKYGIKPN